MYYSEVMKPTKYKISQAPNPHILNICSLQHPLWSRSPIQSDMQTKFFSFSFLGGVGETNKRKGNKLIFTLIFF